VAKSAVDKRTEKKIGENRFFGYLRDTYHELRRVSWPTRSEALNLTGIVIAVTTLLAIILGLMDWLFSWGFGLFL
jgi:preprotein translocase subunit SecE